jgi:NAD(P)-dependent dehydrogenase (short-subunit alcohol dehydrogenase family)
MDQTRHTGKISLVTGAGSGIGRATVFALARAGAVIIAGDINADAVNETLAEASESGAKLEAAHLDVTNQADVDRVVADALRRHGRIDILANVAGILDGFLPAAEVDDATWSRVMDVNVTGFLRTARAVLPSMLEHQSGAIVNVASEAGLRGGLAGVAYTASKHAVVGLTKSIAWHYGRQGVRCNAVCPGSVATNISLTSRSELGSERNGAVGSLSPGRAQPEQIAAAISWLGSSEADNLNGAIVPVDCGWAAG